MGGAQQIVNGRLFATVIPAALGFIHIFVSISWLDLYGWALFLGVPSVVGFLAGFCWNFKRETTLRSTIGAAISSLATLGCLLLLLAMDGLICLLFALPLVSLVAIPGAAAGRWVGRSLGSGTSAAVSGALCAAVPLLVWAEHAGSGPTPTRMAQSAVWVNAPIERVWGTVVAFPRIPEPTEAIFRFGVAYPIEARIEGAGIGAVRYCDFSTGSFVEPVTAWDPPRLLGFDVAENPPPMRELSPHRNLSTPHMAGHMASQRGQFRLTERDGGVLLEGTTWYSHSISPDWYWGPISDWIIHRIHHRVLNHIKQHAERERGRSVGTPVAPLGGQVRILGFNLAVAR